MTVYHDKPKLHRYFCYEADAVDLVRWLTLQGYWFEHRNVESGNDPSHEIMCSVEPDEIAKKINVRVTST